MQQASWNVRKRCNRNRSKFLKNKLLNNKVVNKVEDSPVNIFCNEKQIFFRLTWENEVISFSKAKVICVESKDYG